MSNVTATIIFHAERAFAIPALASMRTMVNFAKAQGISVETRAVLDRADNQTEQLVHQHGAWLDDIAKVDFGDLSLARMHGVAKSNGEYLAFLDGDDLWGEDWLLAAYQLAANQQQPRQAIYHPEYIYYFSENDFTQQAIEDQPSPHAKSCFMLQSSSSLNKSDWNALFIENLWTANAFCHRSVHETFPYRPFERARGIGIEDWSWNLETIWHDIRHLIVPDTVHMIRAKDVGSLGMLNHQDHLLTHLPHIARPIIKQT